ncbi:FtsX-like permease family protein [Actinoplanes sp. NPDC051513]|uniref:FtsX-like permease family protein n=1 Tax=Actinoplanes sp. NPDC051513 TaxID=3363908 RepID=UPI00378F58D7
MKFLPVLHWPSVRGRARADAGPLLLVAIVVAAISLLAAAVPPLLRATADDAARDAIREAPDESAVRVDARWEDDYGPNGGRLRNAGLAEDVAGLRSRAESTLDPGLRAALRPPVTTVTSLSLVVTDGSVQRHFLLAYLRSGDDGPAVTWVAGGAPKATVEGNQEIALNGAPWEVQVGLSEAEAAALKMRPGDHIPLQDEQRNKYNVKVSGIFKPVDTADPAWQRTPWVLRPALGLDGAGTTRLGGLLSDDSLPDARLATLQDQLRRTVWFSAEPDRLTWESAQRLAATVTTLKAESASSAERDDSLKWQTQLDGVLRKVREQVDAATAQASVLLIAVLTGGVLVLLLAADLLTRRRSVALTAARQRGASLPGLASELLIESVAVTVPAAAIGVLLALAVAGSAAVAWVWPVAACAILAGPGFGTVAAARATRDRRTPANRAARRWQQRTAQLRRAALDAAIVLAAAGAIVSLRQRGVGDSALPATAPALGAVAGTLLLLRLMPAGTGLALRQALRSRRPLAVFGAAQAASTATRVLPLLVLTTTTALASFAVTLSATISQGLDDGAWHTVGADARLDVSPDATGSASSLAAKIAASPGVTAAVAGEVIAGVRVVTNDTSVTPSLVIVDAAAFQRLLSETPLPDAPELSRLASGGALVRTADGSLRPGQSLRLYLGDDADIMGISGYGVDDPDKSIELTAIGAAPEIDNLGDVVVVDASALPSEPDTIWATGPGAARAVNAVAAGGHPVLRADVLSARRSSALTAGLIALDLATAVTLLLLGLLGLALGAAATAPERWRTLARLRTLGLRPRDTQRVAAGELLPPVLAAAVFGPLLGVLLVWLSFGALSLSLITGQSDSPVTVVPWWLLGVMAVGLLVALVVVVAAEAAVRRRRGLGDLLRAGE